MESKKILYRIGALLLAAVMCTGCSVGGNSTDQPDSTPSVQSTDKETSAQSSIPDKTSSDVQSTAEQTESSEQTVTSATTETTAAAPLTSTAPPATSSSAATKAPQTEPSPEWKESPASGTYYASADCSTREKAIVGAKAVRSVKAGEKLTVTAKTDTDYYKLSDGSFIHSDYLSKTAPASSKAPQTAAPKPVSTKPAATKPTTTKPVTTKPASAKPTTTKPASTKPSDDSDSYSSASTEEKEMFRAINEYREKNGVPALTWDDNAYRAAKIRAKELVPAWGGHTRPNGSEFQTVYDELGVAKKLSSMGENLAGGSASVQDTLKQWLDSSGHRKNILETKYKSGAIAFISAPNSQYKYYWVQEFTAYFAS